MSIDALKRSALNMTCICVNEVNDKECRGLLYSKYLKEGIEFNQLDQVIIPIEEILDELKMPRASTKSRSFLKTDSSLKKIDINKDTVYWEWNDFKEIKGKLATFFVYVKYRQNSSWQGEVYWKEKDQSVSFFSELEMLKVIDAAIGSLV